MKVDIIMNGTIKIVLSAETDLEKLALSEIAKTEVETLLIDKQTAILYKQVHNGLILQPKSRENKIVIEPIIEEVKE